MAAQDQYLEEFFPEPPLISYKRQRNIRESIIRAKVTPERQARELKGMKKCGKCLACSYVTEGKSIRGKNYKNKKFTWKIGRPVNCNTKNVVYMIECDKNNCNQRYIGYTQQEYRERMFQHIGYVRNKETQKATGEHFNLPGHGMHNMKFSILEKVKSSDPLYGREREKLLIRKFNTYHKGINREP